MTQADANYAGSIPKMYDHYLGPMLFEPFAQDLALRAAALKPMAVLETAAGTGIVTARLAELMSPEASLVSTDLNQAMLDVAVGKVKNSRVEWRVCDALRLPFADESFDCVLCQFGVMFFPSRIAAFSEALRVLKRGGRFLFSAWDNLETNPIPHTISEAVRALYPSDPPDFVRRTPYGYNDREVIAGQLAEAGFADFSLDIVTLPCRSPSPLSAVTGALQGSPLAREIEARNPVGLEPAIAAAIAALTARFGDGPIESTMQALVYSARK